MVTISLPDLPPELLAEVKTNLSYGSCVALRLTCRELYHKVDDPNQHTRGTHSYASTRASSITRNYDMRDLLEIELWPEYNSGYIRPDHTCGPRRTPHPMERGVAGPTVPMRRKKYKRGCPHIEREGVSIREIS